MTATDSHKRATEAFSAYVEGDLGPAERAHVDEHLATCMQCRVSLERFRRTVGVLGALKRSAPVSFLENVQEQINRRSRGRFERHGGCKLCTVLVNGRTQTACTHNATEGTAFRFNEPALLKKSPSLAMA